MARLLESEAVWVLQLKRLILKVKYGHLFVILKELMKGLSSDCVHPSETSILSPGLFQNKELLTRIKDNAKRLYTWSYLTEFDFTSGHTYCS